MSSFNRPRLILSSSSSVVVPVEVTLTESQCFTVDPHRNPRAADGVTVLPPGNPFSIVSACRRRAAVRAADLGIDPGAIAAWHPFFNSRCVIILQMQLANATAKDLVVELFCTQHSSAGISPMAPAADADA